MKKLYICDIGTENNFFKEEIEKSILEQRSYIYIVPTKSLLQQRINEYLDRFGALANFNITTFDKIAGDITASKHPTLIDEQRKKLIIEVILGNMNRENKLSYFSSIYNYSGLIESISQFIRTVKGNLIRPEDFNKWKDDYKILELSHIYTTYEMFLKEHNIYDREGIYLLAQEEMKGKIFLYEDIFIDSFMDMRPLEYLLIENFLLENSNVYINFPFRTGEKNSCADNTTKKLLQMGFEIVNLKSELEGTIIDYGNRGMESKISHIAASKKSYEIEKILSIAKEKNIRGKIEFDQMHIIMCEEYARELIALAQVEKIPLDFKGSVKISSYPLSVEFINILDFIKSAGEKKYLLNMVKSHYFANLDEKLRADIEIKLRQLYFNNISDLEEMLTGDIFENPQLLEETKSFLCKAKYLLNLGETNSISELSIFFINYINEKDIKNNIISDYNLRGDEKILQRDLSLLKILQDTLEIAKKCQIFFPKVNFTQFYNLMLNYLRDIGYNEQSNRYGIKVYSPVEGIGLNAKLKFICGLGKDYPKIAEDNFLMCGDYAKVLRELGLVLDEPYYNGDKEDIKILDIIERCKESIYLSCVKNDLDESGDCSAVLSNILEANNIVQIRADAYLCEDYKNISNPSKLAAKILRDNYFDNEIDSDYLALSNSLSNLKKLNSKILCEVQRGVEFNQYCGKLSSVGAYKENKTYSSSEFEDYALCPFYYYLKRILKVNEMKRDFVEQEALDLGNIMHKVLENYYKKLIIESPNKALIYSEETLVQELKSVLTKSQSAQRNEKYFYNYIFIRLKNMINNDIERMKKDDCGFLPKYFEENFSFDLEEISIRGKIDRIDVKENKEILIDYKLSRASSKSDIEAGISLQMPIYTLARESKGAKVVACEYAVLKGGEFSSPLRNICEVEKYRGSRSGVDAETYYSIINNSKDIIKFLYSKIKEEDFSVNPLKCLENMCDYRNVCRYFISEGGDIGVD